MIQKKPFFDKFTDSRLWLVSGISLLLITLCYFQIQSDDLYMYLAIGREYLKTGRIPELDPFIYSIVNYKWEVIHEWAGYLTFFEIFQKFSWQGVVLFKTALILLIYIIPLIKLKNSKQSVLVWAIFSCLSGYCSEFRFTERTALFSDLFTMLVFWILFSEKKGASRFSYLLPVIFLLWVNLHPGFLLGWALIAIYFISESFQIKDLDSFKRIGKKNLKMSLLVVFSALACLVNPRGIHGIIYPLEWANGPGQLMKRFYYEWMPTLSPFMFGHSLGYLILFQAGIAILLIGVSYFLNSGFICSFEFLCFLFFIFFEFCALRFVPLGSYGLAAVSMILLDQSSRFQRWAETATQKVISVSLLFSLILWSVSIHSILKGHSSFSGERKFGSSPDESFSPVKAAQFILQSQLKNVFNTHLFGAFLAWEWQGKRKVFYHGFVTDMRFFVEEYSRFMNREDFEEMVRRYQIDGFILDRFANEAPFFKILEHHPDWTLAYLDTAAAVFVKKEAKSRPSSPQ